MVACASKVLGSMLNNSPPPPPPLFHLCAWPNRHGDDMLGKGKYLQIICMGKATLIIYVLPEHGGPPPPPPPPLRFKEDFQPKVLFIYFYYFFFFWLVYSDRIPDTFAYWAQEEKIWKGIWAWFC